MIKLRNLFRKIVEKIIFLQANEYDRKFDEIYSKFKRFEDLNANKFDEEIEKISDALYQKCSEKFIKSTTANPNEKKKIITLATEIYNTGGHTPCFINFIKSFYKEYNLEVLLVKLNLVKNHLYKEKFSELKELATVDGVNWNLKLKNYSKAIIDLYNKILAKNANIIFVYIHSNDVVSASVLCLLQKHSNIKIIVFNHLDHFPLLGLKFCHLIIDARKSAQDINVKIRGYEKSYIVPLQSHNQSYTIYHSKEEIKNLRKSLGISDDNYFTLTGCNNYKIFDKDDSEYLKMIRNLLIKEPKLKHVLMTRLSRDKKIIFDRIFKDHQDLLNRIVIINPVSEFDIFFQSCDLFIDSFPQGSALTHIDMMRNKKPTVVKINKAEPFKSFESYLPKNYKYAYEEAAEMMEGVLELLHLEEERRKISNQLFDYYLNNNEFEVVKKIYKEIIENSDNLEKFYYA